VLYIASTRERPLDGGDIFSLTEAPSLDFERAALFLRTYADASAISDAEIQALPDFIRARWLYARTAGARKVSAEERAQLFFREIDKPLAWIDTHCDAFARLCDASLILE